MPLNILIVGAGLGGLAAAISVKLENPDHRVQVIESAPALAEVIPPSRTKKKMLTSFSGWSRPSSDPKCYQAVGTMGLAS